MGPLGAAPWHPERFCFIATALSASTGVTAPDKVDRLEARTAFRAPEPDARPEAVAVGEPGALQAAVAVPDAQQAAVVVAAPGAPQVAVPDAQQEAVAPDAAVAAEPDVQREAAAAEASGAQQEAAVAAVSGAQREAAAAAVSDAQREAAAEASGARQAVGPVAVARPLVASVESAGTAAVRFWIRATMVSAAALERRVVSAAKVQAAADR